MLERSFGMAELIARHLSGTLTAQEEEVLKIWRERSPQNEQLFRKLCDEQNFLQYQKEYNNFDKQDGWKQINKKIEGTVRRKYILKAISYAAAVTIPLVIGLYVYTSQKYTPEISTSYIAQADLILPGETKAILTLDNGEVIDLTEVQQKEVNEKDGTAILIAETSLNYQSAGTNIQVGKEMYNKVEIPHGGEYSLWLSDGTKVHLNAMSSLRFPVHFTGDTRSVELEGEAYFEVAKSDRPFLVNVHQMQVEVLGTAFNISAYQGENYETTLVGGAVKIHTTQSEATYTLKPSEQAIFNTKTDEVKIQQVDTELYTSWIHGKIYFKDTRLEDMMTTLSRWYDMAVIYQDSKIKDLRFGCNVDRYEEITPFLELLEKTGKVKIRLDGKNIHIK